MHYKDLAVFSLSQFMVPNKFFIKNSSTRKHKNFVLSLTSSPLRLKQVQSVLTTFTQHRKVILNLPKKFRNIEPYNLQDIENLQLTFPTLHIHWLEKDLGPHTKLLGALSCPLIREDDYVVVLDDDTHYNNELLDAYADAIQQQSGQVYTPYLSRRFGLSIPEGCNSFCVGIKDLLNATEKTSIQDMSTLFHSLANLYTMAHEKCKFHDDIVFAAVFHELQLNIFQITETPFPAAFQMVEGYGTDALHIISNNNEKDYLCAQAIWATKQMCPTEENTNSFLSN